MMNQGFVVLSDDKRMSSPETLSGSSNPSLVKSKAWNVVNSNIFWLRLRFNVEIESDAKEVEEHANLFEIALCGLHHNFHQWKRSIQ